MNSACASKSKSASAVYKVHTGFNCLLSLADCEATVNMMFLLPFSRSVEGIEIENIQRRMFEPLKHLTHM